MRRVRVGLWLLLAGALSAQEARAQVATAPDNVQEPPAALVTYVVDVRDGSLTAMDRKRTKHERGGQLGYIELDTPPLVIQYGTPLLFAYRFELRSKDFSDRIAPGGKVDDIFVIEVLALPRRKDGTPVPEDARRYATRKFAPVLSVMYGPRKAGIDPKKPNLASQTYLMWPTAPLPPGDYAVTPRGGLFSCFGCDGFGEPFRIVVAPAGPSVPSAAAAPRGGAPPQSPSIPATGTGRVTIESTPGDAEVSVDGELIGTTPLVGYPLSAGTRRITVSKRGYSSWTRELKVSAGVETRLAAELEARRD